MEVVTTGAIRCAKLQSNCHFCGSTADKHPRQWPPSYTQPLLL